ncbi:hypothetical protein [Mycolicibacterium llatzerense]|uniref:hypothetical protein n=1 Tax=Mycolicibacterium llatzerense TaxID=280871 RepID=UPI0021B5D683|nr:hypothetical protein [Mycolicibacterium llatzerense]
MRDQIIAALKRAYPMALTTVALAEQLPPVVAKINDDCSGFFCGRTPPNVTPVLELLECHATWHLVRRPRLAADIHRHLMALEHTGQVSRIARHRSAHSDSWTVDPDATAIREIAELERAWTAL